MRQHDIGDGRKALQGPDGQMQGSIGAQVPTPQPSVAFEYSPLSSVPANERIKGEVYLNRDGRPARWLGSRSYLLCAEPGCGKLAMGNTKHCVSHGGGKRCTEPGCGNSAAGKTNFCTSHGGGKRCTEPGCNKGALGKTSLCCIHGGGKRCTEPGCGKSAAGKTDLCIAHGGGKRCAEPGCGKGAAGATDLCIAHGGGKRCAEPGCGKGAVSTNTDYCSAHGGGRRCSEQGCDKGAQGVVAYCREHAPRCIVEDCKTSSTRESGICDWHEANGVDAVNSGNWQSRTWRLYIVHYPDFDWVKVGVEASKRDARVSKWLDVGGVLLDEIILSKEEALEWGHALFLTEQRLTRTVLPAMFATPDRGAYCEHIADDADGLKETFALAGTDPTFVVDMVLDEWTLA